MFIFKLTCRVVLSSFVILLFFAGHSVSAEEANVFQWQPASPESQGMSTERLNELKNELSSRATRAFLVVRNDKIVYEYYSEGNDAGRKQGTASLAKAIVGGLSLAVAVTDGKMSLDDAAWKYVPQWKNDPVKSKITIRHLGSHTSGIDDSHNREEQARGVLQKEYTGWSGEFWRWSDGKQRPPLDAFTISRDVAPVRFDPGSDFQYSNPGIAMLGYCVTASLKEGPHCDVRTLLRERIMKPIGIADDDWSCGYGRVEEVDGLPIVANWGGAKFTPRATARIGRLMLKQGDWDGTRFLSADAVRLVTGDAGLPGHCGMGWWTNADGRLAGVPKDAVWGLGAGHQILLVVPSLNLIMVRNGNDLFSRSESRDRIGEILFAPLIAAINPESKSQSAIETPPYECSPVIQRMEFDFRSHRRLAIGSDNWPMTWASDGHQYAAWGDGGGFGGTNSDGRVKLGVARIAGAATSYKGSNVWGGKNAENPCEFDGKSYGLLSVDGAMHMWVASEPAKHMQSCSIATSTDMGAHWTLADWSFRYEDQLCIPTFLNFGQDYQGARDDYVYSYFTHPTWRGEAPLGNYGFDVHRPGRIYLSRVAKSEILNRDGFQFFCGLGAHGEPLWTTDLKKKNPVFEDANGVGWNLSITYSSVLRRYLLCTEHSATHGGNLGIFDAPEPWGPWTTVAYESGWGADQIEPSTFHWSFPNRWFEPDGRCTMVFTGKNSNDSLNTVQARFITTEKGVARDLQSPVPASPIIDSIRWAPKESIIRAAKGGDNWPMTWGDDDHLYTAYGDGCGFEPLLSTKLSMGFARVEKGPLDLRGFNIRSESGETVGQGEKGIKASGALMVDGVLYLLVRNAGNSRLGWSADHGATWTWADWKFNTSFGCPTFLNFGKNYGGARDEFVYIYSLDGDSAYTPANQMVMARVPQTRLRDQSAYEFFVQIGTDGKPVWSSRIEDRGAVFEHEGRCYRSGVTYNAGLKRYLWCQVFPESTHAQGPRFQGGFGIFDAPEPWGPWTTVYFTNDWDVGPGETSSFPTKWMSEDGQTLHLVFSGDDYFSVRHAQIELAKPVALRSAPDGAAKAVANTQRSSQRPAPDFADVSYGPHERHVLDFWRAKSDQPTPFVVFIHGGGFAGGSKEGLKTSTLRELLGAGISVAAVNYRYYQQAGLPAALHDCRRTLQFVRSKSAEWNLDKSRAGATGGSAGAIASMYLAFHDEMANPESLDPIERESTRLTCVATTAGQTTLDTVWWAKNVPGWPVDEGVKADGHAYRRWGCNEADFPALIADGSALGLISSDDPPIWMSYGMSPDDLMPADSREATNWRVHHVAFGVALKNRMNELNVESALNYPKAAQRSYKSLTDFLIRKLRSSDTSKSQ